MVDNEHGLSGDVFIEMNGVMEFRYHRTQI